MLTMAWVDGADPKTGGLMSTAEVSCLRARMVQFGCMGLPPNILCYMTTSSRTHRTFSWAQYSTKQPTSRPTQTHLHLSRQTQHTPTPLSPAALTIIAPRPGVFGSSTALTSSSMVLVCTVSSRTGVLPTVLPRRTANSIWWTFRTQVMSTFGHWALSGHRI